MYMSRLTCVVHVVCVHVCVPFFCFCYTIIVCLFVCLELLVICTHTYVLAKQSQRITHLICAEVGGVNSLEPLVVGAEKGLPVMDADGMGRAFPELQMYLPFIYGCKPYPSTVADNKGEVITCTHVSNSKQLEDFFRVECVRMG